MMHHQSFIEAATGGRLTDRESRKESARKDYEDHKPGKRRWRVVLTSIYLGCALLSNAFAAYFITQERYVYIWDSAFYWIRFREFSALLAADPFHGILELLKSMRHDSYNLLPVLFLTPFAWLFGPSRLSYVLAITNVYLLPTIILMSLLVKRLYSQCLHQCSLAVPALTALTALVFHPLWVPLLHGMLDVSGCVMIAAFLLLYIAKPFEQQTVANLLLMGLLLSLMVLLRRWYAFWVVGFFVALILDQAVSLGAKYGTKWRYYLRSIRNGTIIAATLLVALVSLAAGFLVRALITDHSDIYSAFRKTDSLLEKFGLLWSYFGPAATLVSVAGLLWMIVCKETRWFGFFLIAQAATVLALFWQTQDFGMHHYYLLTPTFLLGISVPLAHTWFVLSKPWHKWGAAGSCVLLLLAGTVSVVSPTAAVMADKLGAVLPGFRYPPKVRTDIDTLDRLLDDLETITADRPGQVYVLASSHVLNDGVLTNACRYGAQPRMFCDEILETHNIDRRDGFPNQFVDARYVVLASPTQYHMRPEDQRLVGILARDVRRGSGVGAAFSRLPGEYVLDRGVRVWLYEKVKPFEKADLDGLQQEFIRHYPERAYMFTIGQDARDRDRYCWVKQKSPWLYEMIRAYRQEVKAPCPDTEPKHD